MLMSFIKCFYETIFGIIEALPIDGGTTAGH